MNRRYHEKFCARKAIITILASALLASAAGAGLKKKQDASNPVEHKKTDVIFIGYKTTVKVKATPTQVEEYLLDVKNLSAELGIHKYQVLSTKKMEKPGDIAEFKDTFAGITFPGQLILVYFQSGTEFWYLSRLGADQISLLRIVYKQLPDGTRLTISHELENVRGIRTLLGELVNIQNLNAKFIDHQIVKIQSRFDPSLNADDLLKKGNLGEFYSAFFQGEQMAVRINSSPEKLVEYLSNPKTWQRWKDQYGYDFGQCLAAGKDGLCPVRLRISGEDLKIDSFAGEFKPGAYSSAYWVAKPVIAGVGASVKPWRGGSQLVVQYMIDAPSESAALQDNLMMTMVQIPKLMEQFLVGIKNDPELSPAMK